MLFRYKGYIMELIRRILEWLGIIHNDHYEELLAYYDALEASNGYYNNAGNCEQLHSFTNTQQNTTKHYTAGRVRQETQQKSNSCYRVIDTSKFH